MSQVQKNIDLLPYNTFRVSVKAKKFVILRDLSDLSDIPDEPILVLGSGANILLTHDVDGLVIKNNLAGRKVIQEDDDSIELEIASGESWIDLVNWTMENGWSGIENLAFIPGTIGAAVVGNIAAYGGNFEDVFVDLKAVEVSSGKDQVFSKDELKFGYRESVFSKELRDKYFLTSVTIKLSKIPNYDTHYHSRYESLAAYLPDHPSETYTPKEIAEAVTRIRLDKLPDWRKVGTAGSFFKNPIVQKEKVLALQKKISDLQTYPAEKLIYTDQALGDLVKLPAGRLLDELGWKGKKIGNVGTWKNHALTVVNYGRATGEEILNFTNQMRADIKSYFDIDLEPEVNIV